MAFVIGGCLATGALPRVGRPATAVSRPRVTTHAGSSRRHVASMTAEEPAAAAATASSDTSSPPPPAAPAPVIVEEAAAEVKDTTSSPSSPAWTAAVDRLSAAVPAVPREEVEAALDESGGLEMRALALLTSSSDRIAQREAEIAEYRANGRISAMEEAALRRKVVGSAADFFKSYVEVKGEYVDQGYVDESSDTMGKVGEAVQKFFGKFSKTSSGDGGKK